MIRIFGPKKAGQYLQKYKRFEQDQYHFGKLLNSSTKIKKKVDPKSSTHSSKQTELHGSFCIYLYFYVFIFIYFFIILCCPNTNIYKGNQIIFCWDNHMFMIIALGQCLYCKILVLKLRILCQYFLYQFLGIIISSHFSHFFFV